jgi:excisionase family DNA binding protein
MYKGRTIIGGTMGNILTTKELADYLKLTETTIYRYVREGKVPAYWKDGRWKFRKNQIDALLKGMELQKAPMI